MDLGELYDRIKARDYVAGRPATDPQVVLGCGCMRPWRGSARRGRLTGFTSNYRQILVFVGIGLQPRERE
jgi:hypothetical protein